jgi:hypothetical protein
VKKHIVPTISALSVVLTVWIVFHPNRLANGLANSFREYRGREVREASGQADQVDFARRKPEPIPIGSEKLDLDQYGGLRAMTTSKGATGRFRVEKIGNRWVFITPLGHPFWMQGAFDVIADDRFLNFSAKYGSGGNSSWAIHATRRLSSWGFNTAAEYSSAYVFPDNPGVVKLPYAVIVRPSYYGLRNRDKHAPAAFKDLVDTLNGTYKGYRGGNTPDVFDPNFATFAREFIPAEMHNEFWGGRATSAWAVGITIDETDDLFGFGPGPEVPAARLHPHIGWFALAANPTFHSSTKWGQSYPDPKVYSKYKLQALLQAKYGTIAALNAAWGAYYTTWESAGGYGTGTGLLDEDGRHSKWLGTTEGTLTGAAPNVVADLDAFLYEYAKQYFSITSAAVRQAAPRQLVFSPASLNGWGGLTRRQILQAAGQYCDVLNAGVGSDKVLELTFQYAGDMPLVSWEGYVANPDSDMFSYPPSNLIGDLGPRLTFNTQRERGEHYAQRINFLLNPGMIKSGVKTVVGFKYWGWADSWGEKLNWGLTSLKDNAYDGKEAVVAPGVDPWGYRTGGEQRDYGDFLSWVKAANRKAISDLCNELQVTLQPEGGPSSNSKDQESRRKEKLQPQLPCPQPFPQSGVGR